MTLDDLIQALALPDATRVNQRVPKKLLAEQEVATAADRRQIQEGADEIIWLAALKPHLIGVSTYEDAQRQYVELAVLSLVIKPGTKPGRLVELLHRAVPYPVLLFTTSDAGVSISLAHLRTSQNEADKMVLDGDVFSMALPGDDANGAALEGFRTALALSRQPHADLFTLYQGWLDTVAALDIARETGTFRPSLTRAQAIERHQTLLAYRDLQTKLQRLRAQAQRERQLARQVALNQELRAGQAALQRLQKRLNGEPA
ncbi:MAG: hypothetical protein RI907_716 [Pseudomonadota bacterium]